MNDIINTSEEEWVVQTPPPIRNSLNMNDTINTSSKLASESVNKSLPDYGKIDIYNESEEEWIVETPPNCQTFQMSDKIKAFREKSTSKSLSVNEITLLNNDKNYTSKERIFKNGTTLKKNNLTNTLEEEWIVDSHLCSSSDETKRACEERHGKSFCRKSNFEPGESYENRCGRSYNNQTQFELNKIDKSRKYKCVKPYFELDENNNTDRGIYKKSFSRKTIHSLNDGNKSNENRFTNLPYRSVCKSDKFYGNKKKWNPNIKAPEFVPQRIKKIQSNDNTEQFSPSHDSTYSHFSLRDLLNYDVDLMPSEELMDYANALKLRVSDEISEFEPSYKEELEVLCQLNDGSLTDRNIKIISLRICALVERTVVNKPECNQERFHRYNRFHKLAGS